MIKAETINYEFLIDRAKEMQGFKYDNEVDAALGFKASIMTRLRKNKAHLSEEKMIELAKLAKVDSALALIALNVMRSEGQTRSLYMEIAQKVSTLSLMLLAVLLISSAPAHAATGLTTALTKPALYIITFSLIGAKYDNYRSLSDGILPI